MDGILIIDKPSGMTSRDVVNQTNRILNNKHIGHTGTLDPMATGVLVLCIGKATKIGELITSYDKEYIAEVTLGIATDTLDINGNVINEADVNVTKEQVEDALQSFVGEIEQEVPQYSAIKINGRRLYNYARKGIDIELPIRKVQIYKLSLVDDLKEFNGKIKFKIDCVVSKGTYIRSLIRDIGDKLGCPACMSSLRRIKQGDFNIDQAYTLDQVEQGNYSLLSINDTLSYIPAIIVNKELETKVRNGAFIDKTFTSDMVRIINSAGELIAIYKTDTNDNTKAKPFKMFI